MTVTMIVMETISDTVKNLRLPIDRDGDPELRSLTLQATTALLRLRVFCDEELARSGAPGLSAAEHARLDRLRSITDQICLGVRAVESSTQPISEG